MNDELVLSLQKQNRLLKSLLGLGVLVGLLVAAKTPSRQRFEELDAERINIVTPDGKRELVLANRFRLPAPVVDGKEQASQRGQRAGLVFYNQAGDECGGLIWDGKLDAKRHPESGMHFSMDRFGGDQQLALGHYEDGGTMETGLTVYDRGLSKDYEPLFDAYRKAPEGPEKEALKRKWEEAGGPQTPRVFVGRTRGQSSAVIMADKNGLPRIMMLVTQDGTPILRFLDAQGNVVQQLPEKAGKS